MRLVNVVTCISSLFIFFFILNSQIAFDMGREDPAAMEEKFDSKEAQWFSKWALWTSSIDISPTSMGIY